MTLIKQIKTDKIRNTNWKSRLIGITNQKISIDLFDQCNQCSPFF